LTRHPQTRCGEDRAANPRVRPHVVVTFDHNGLYGHPDHIAICQHATAAVAAAGDPSFSDQDGRAAHHVSKLYYMAWTKEDVGLYQSAFGELTMHVNGQRRGSAPWQEWAITTRVDASGHWRQVWEAIKRHRSQLPGYQKLVALPEEAHKRLWGSPRYYRVFSRVNVPQVEEDDLFEGLRWARPHAAPGGVQILLLRTLDRRAAHVMNQRRLHMTTDTMTGSRTGPETP
jgi:LmbE family N-acetylglucosaminyl deacetylase